MRLAAMIAVVVFIGVISINVSKSRRSQFLAERTFERAVEAAVQVSPARLGLLGMGAVHECDIRGVHKGVLGGGG